MTLLELPLEILRVILETTLKRNGLDHTIGLRLVCRIFDIEVIRAIVATKALDSPDYRHRYHGDRLYSEYLLARTMADHERKYHLSGAVHGTVDYILQETGEDISRREEYMRGLCMSMVQSCYTWVVARILNPAYCFSDDSIPRKECSLEQNALAAAAHFGMVPLFQKLVGDGVKSADTYFGRPLECAARRGDYEMTYTLLEKGFKLYSIGFANCRALERAARHGHLSVVRLLLEPKYNLDYFPRDIENAIREAAAGGYQNIIDFLKPRTGRLFEPLVIEDRILMSAALHDKEDVARTALDNGADPNAANYPLMKWSSILEGVTRKGYEGIVRLLLERGATLRPRRKANPLIQAIRGGWLPVAQILIDNGAEVNPQSVPNDPNPLNPLSTAIERGNVEMIKLLLENGAESSLISTHVASHDNAAIKKLLAQHQAALSFDQSVE